MIRIRFVLSMERILRIQCRRESIKLLLMREQHDAKQSDRGSAALCEVDMIAVTLYTTHQSIYMHMFPPRVLL